MNSQRDEDALGWAGDDDPTLQSGTAESTPGSADVPPAAPEPPTAAEPPAGWTVAGPTAAVEADNERRRAATPMGSFTLIALGVFGGIYLLYTIGWFIGISRIDNPLSDAVGQFMFSLGLWLAVAAPAAWFGATFWLTRTGPRARLAVLLLGVLLLAPLPFIINAGGIS
ncbi:DNA polymerase III subunit gamma/tau [Cryobacterium fucosi]|uniref:DNA polymerase III subunit gamma/tau n=1 Tax=Cryobacterium fucosi TaxID=1259157 RepID=A0A4R9B7Q4_9MICO|nr:DNA polymerase III subunit gamma/tau [Cryobacterium fucosi]TFD77734.1 DNA polymerase III subunit gamma/tau [Cryobacterium fucosi]